jgi:hypothetical protein
MGVNADFFVQSNSKFWNVRVGLIACLLDRFEHSSKSFFQLTSPARGLNKDPTV